MSIIGPKKVVALLIIFDIRNSATLEYGNLITSGNENFMRNSMIIIIVVWNESTNCGTKDCATRRKVYETEIQLLEYSCRQDYINWLAGPQFLHTSQYGAQPFLQPLVTLSWQGSLFLISLHFVTMRFTRTWFAGLELVTRFKDIWLNMRVFMYTAGH